MPGYSMSTLALLALVGSAGVAAAQGSVNDCYNGGYNNGINDAFNDVCNSALSALVAKQSYNPYVINEYVIGVSNPTSGFVVGCTEGENRDAFNRGYARGYNTELGSNRKAIYDECFYGTDTTVALPSASASKSNISTVLSPSPAASKNSTVAIASQAAIVANTTLSRGQASSSSSGKVSSMPLSSSSKGSSTVSLSGTASIRDGIAVDVTSSAASKASSSSPAGSINPASSSSSLPASSSNHSTSSSSAAASSSSSKVVTNSSSVASSSSSHASSSEPQSGTLLPLTILSPVSLSVSSDSALSSATDSYGYLIEPSSLVVSSSGEVSSLYTEVTDDGSEELEVATGLAYATPAPSSDLLGESQGYPSSEFDDPLTYDSTYTDELLSNEADPASSDLFASDIRTSLDLLSTLTSDSSGLSSSSSSSTTMSSSTARTTRTLPVSSSNTRVKHRFYPKTTTSSSASPSDFNGQFDISSNSDVSATIPPKYRATTQPSTTVASSTKGVRTTTSSTVVTSTSASSTTTLRQQPKGIIPTKVRTSSSSHAPASLSQDVTLIFEGATTSATGPKDKKQKLKPTSTSTADGSSSTKVVSDPKPGLSSPESGGKVRSSSIAAEVSGNSPQSDSSTAFQASLPSGFIKEAKRRQPVFKCRWEE